MKQKWMNNVIMKLMDRRRAHQNRDSIKYNERNANIRKQIEKMKAELHFTHQTNFKNCKKVMGPPITEEELNVTKKSTGSV